MDVYINSKGNAMIIEKWKVNLSQGTEGYKAYKKMDNSIISNFRVTDDSRKMYEYL